MSIYLKRGDWSQELQERLKLLSRDFDLWPGFPLLDVLVLPCHVLM